MEIKYTSLHHIDHSNGTVREIEIDQQSTELSNYVGRLLEEIIQSNNKRSFTFRSEASEVRRAIGEILAEDYSLASLTNAQRLLEVEKLTQEKIKHLNSKIHKGILFHAFVVNEHDEKSIIISKADHDEYLDEFEFQLRTGLPYRKRVFKAILVTFDGGNEVKSVYVYDTNAKMSTYWWQTYLELVEKYTDSQNTKKSLEIIDKKIFNKIKIAYPADHVILRNSFIGYFRNKEEFELSDFVNQIFRNYHPIDPDLPLGNIIEQISNLPDRWEFDKRFGIRNEEINKRAVNKIRLANNLELVMKDHIENLRNLITAEEDPEGNKFIRIKSEEGFKIFNNA